MSIPLKIVILRRGSGFGNETHFVKDRGKESRVLTKLFSYVAAT